MAAEEDEVPQVGAPAARPVVDVMRVDEAPLGCSPGKRQPPSRLFRARRRDGGTERVLRPTESGLAIALHYAHEARVAGQATSGFRVQSRALVAVVELARPAPSSPWPSVSASTCTTT